MFQTVLMFLAPPQATAWSESRVCRPASRMATRVRDWNEARSAGVHEARHEGQVSWLAVAGNALGFALLMTGLWLVVRLVETLLG